MKRLMLAMAVACILAANAVALAAAQPAPEFKLGFKALADQIPDVVGQPLEDEHWGPNGDSLQQTSKGLMAWRKTDNWTAFTNGAMTWINGPAGVQSRPNDQRFEWEANQPAQTQPASAVPTTGGAQPQAPPAITNPDAKGQYVTSSHHTATLYYHWTDSRWTGLAESNRHWFNSVEELKAVYPDRKPAP